MVERGALPGFQKPLSTKKPKPVGLAVIHREGGLASCSCGWVTRHDRDNVIEDRVDRHFAKKHNGRGIRL